jgi:Uma2 family endonuclease
MTALPKHKMTVAEFIPWAMAQSQGRYELVRGEVVAQASERARHNLAKLAAVNALSRAIKKAGLPCTAFTDGMTVRIDDFTAREPDAAVQCGKSIDPDAVLLDAPVIVVEVVSPSSERDDTGAKLSEYFSVPSIQHYLIIDPFRKVVVHHARQTAGDIRTQILSAGTLAMTPPGLAVDVSELLPTA